MNRQEPIRGANSIADLDQDQLRAVISKQLREHSAYAPSIAESQIHITPFHQQGASKRTYIVHASDKDFVLSIYTPHPVASFERTSFENQHGFQAALRAKGVPVPAMVGEPFIIPGTPYFGELSEFCHGYQLHRGVDANERELTSVGDVLGRMHTTPFKPTNHHLNWTERLRPYRFGKPLPHGFLHNDAVFGNFIFDPTTNDVRGIIDFEVATVRPYAHELARAISHFASHATVDKTGEPHFTIDPTKRDIILLAYEKHRPLSAAEHGYLDDRLTRELVMANEKHNQSIQRHRTSLSPQGHAERIETVSGANAAYAGR